MDRDQSTFNPDGGVPTSNWGVYYQLLGMGFTEDQILNNTNSATYSNFKEAGGKGERISGEPYWRVDYPESEDLKLQGMLKTLDIK